MSAPRFRSVLERLARAYPPRLVDHQLGDIARISFHLELVANGIGPAGRVCDVGGGIGMFTPGLAALGYDAVLVDDFGDTINAEFGVDDVMPLHHPRLQIHKVDILDALPVEDGSLDAVCQFGVIEHLHRSPRDLLHRMREALVPGGLYVLSGPNSANAVKRVEAVVGRTEWSPFDEWYHRPAFRSHVREPSVRDLQRIAVDLELDHIQILGANWIGQDADSRARRTVARIADPLLRKSPALCSEIYLIGRRPR